MKLQLIVKFVLTSTRQGSHFFTDFSLEWPEKEKIKFFILHDLYVMLVPKVTTQDTRAVTLHAVTGTKILIWFCNRAGPPYYTVQPELIDREYFLPLSVGSLFLTA